MIEKNFHADNFGISEILVVPREIAYRDNLLREDSESLSLRGTSASIIPLNTPSNLEGASNVLYS